VSFSSQPTPGFGTTIQWDTPLLEGYPWLELPPSAGPALRQLLSEGDWNALVLYTGYRRRIFWSALLSAKRNGIPVLFGTDATSFHSQTGGFAKPLLKRLLLPFVFRLADVAIVPSSGSRDFLLAMGVDQNRVVLTPFVVDNDWWRRAAASAHRESTRREWRIPLDAPVLLFCAKLQPWKRPGELLSAFLGLAVANAHLIFAGEGPLRSQLQADAHAASMNDRIHFLGFANQSQLPAIYKAADVLVLPSSYEPFGVVVNEAMLCGCTVVVSNKVGAGRDLVVPGQTGLIYPSGDALALRSVLADLLENPSRLERLKRAAQERVAAWSPEAHINALIGAVDRARVSLSKEGRGSDRQ
jgi:glycosyltransferase involved in cell wall biosynthesis